MLTIRKATLQDLAAIAEIYNEALRKTTATLDSKPKTIDEQKAWFAQHGGKYPVLVAEEGGVIAGWASLSRWSDRCGYADTAEASLYVKVGRQGKGIGRKLIAETLRAGQNAGLHSVMARITAGNETSLHLAESLGFEHIGVMKEVGRKFGRLLDVHLMQKLFNRPEIP